MKLSKRWSTLSKQKYKKYFFPALLVIILLISYFLLYQMGKPENYHVKLFSVAEKTIRAPKTIEDTKKTEEEQKKAIETVEDVYIFNRETSKNRIALVKTLFDDVEKINAEFKATVTKNEEKPARSQVVINEKMKKLKEKLSNDISEKISFTLTDQTLQSLLQADNSDLEIAKENIINEIDKTMEKPIHNDRLYLEKIELQNKIKESHIDSYLKPASEAIASYALVSNQAYSKQATEDRKKEAAQSVHPVKILQGQVIVQEGQIVDREVYRQLKLLQLLDKKMPLKQLIGYVLFLSSWAFLLYYCCKSRMKKENLHQEEKMVMFASIYLLILFVFFMLRVLESVNFTNIAFLFPAAFAPILLKILINEKTAFLSIVFIAATSLLVFQNEVLSMVNGLLALFILLSGTTSVLLLQDYSKRSAVIQTGFFVGLFNIIYAAFILMINNINLISLSAGLTVLYAFLGGLGSFILAIGIVPIFESIFGILTTSRLVELTSPNHPLLRKILIKAPGTYHHSMMVANLSEACADQIGANSLFVRVSCFYHDIGKTVHPPYFAENQLQGINPHERLTPKQSRDIILAHTTEGAGILKKYHIPKPIIDIALEHHGTTILKYFFFKEKERDPDVNEASFRYPGPKPQTKEAAIINIADSVEAAVRASSSPTQEKIKEIINKIVEDRLLDEQFIECDLTLQELDIIKKTLLTTLNGIYHQRVQYPDDKKGGE